MCDCVYEYVGCVCVFQGERCEPCLEQLEHIIIHLDAKERALLCRFSGEAGTRHIGIIILIL